jgi:hypothetical protein
MKEGLAMMILKIVFVAVLCVPLVYISILLLTKLMDQVIGKK